MNSGSRQDDTSMRCEQGFMSALKKEKCLDVPLSPSSTIT